MKNNRYQKTLSAKTGKALATLPGSAPERERGGPPPARPENATQERLFSIWASLLRKDDFDIRANFFQLGGSSLKATQMISQIARQLHVNVGLTEVFDHPTIEELSGLIATKKAIGFQSIQPVAPQESYELSHAQRRLWVLSQFGGGAAVYNIPLVFRAEGEINEDAFRRALHSLVVRHESLRTIFVEADDEPRQKILSPEQSRFALKIADLSAEADPEEAARAAARAEAARPFDLSNGPLVRATLVRLGETSHLFLLTLHHIIGDGWSIRVLMNDLLSFYRSFAQGVRHARTALRIQYKDYAAWQNTVLGGEQIQKHADYWQSQLGGELPVLELPGDFPRPAVKTYRGAKLTHGFTPQTAARAYELGHGAGASLFMVLTAAVNALFYRYTGAEDVVVGSPIAGREHSDLEDQIGFYVNTLALRTRFRGRDGFAELIGRVKQTALAAYEHQVYPFDRLVDDLKLGRDLSRTPLFDVMVVLHNTDVEIEGGAAGLTFDNLSSASEVSKFDLTFNFRETDGGLTLTLEYSTDLFSESRVRRIALHLETLLSAAAAQPDAALDSLDYIPDDEKRLLVTEFNRTRRPFPSDKSVAELFEETARRFPERAAVIFGGRTLTYRALNERANQLARFLREDMRVENDELIGVLMDRGEEMLIALLGVWKAGAAYVPIDPAFPAERVRYVVGDSRMRFLLGERKHSELYAQLPIEAILTDERAAAVGGYARHDLESRACAEARAYVIYTSGSTGKPKGVEVTHGSVVNFLKSIEASPGVSAEDRLLAVTTYSFDISVLELFLPLLTGACVLLADGAQAADGERLLELMRAALPTVMQATPSTWQMLLDSGWAGDAGLKALCGGERLTSELGLKLLGRVGELWNMYGPTETTVWSTAKRVGGEDDPGSVGTPIANTQVYILDGRRRLTPIGVAGEVCLGGAGVSRGYLNRPGLTAEKFIPSPFAAGERIYCTGDVGCRLPGGDIELQGRKDYQVKVRGHRVELGEVENALLAHPSTREAVVTTGQDEGGAHLIAYVVAAGEPDAPGLRAFLRTQLPEYMIPSHFVHLDKLPLTPNGKTDRKALPPLNAVELNDGADYVAPRNAAERGLVEIWRQILNRPEVGIRDNFFEIGGHSLKATRMVSRVYKEMSAKVTLRDVFVNPTIEALAGVVAASGGEAYEGIDPLDPPEAHADAPFDYEVSHAQRRLWILDQLEENQIAYNMPSAYALEGPLDVGAFAAACEALVARHESLRTTFPSVGGEPKQRVHPAAGFPFGLETIDLRGAENPDEEAGKLAAREAATPFDLKRGPLVRAKLLRLADEKFVALFTLHHIISDGWSMVVLLNEALALYDAFRRGAENPLPPLPIQYRNYAAWQRRQLSGEKLRGHQQYWREQFADHVPVLELPGDFTRPAVKTYRGGRLDCTMDAALGRDLASLGRRTGTSLFMLVVAAVNALLYRYSGQDDIVVGSPIAGRDHRELEGQIGFYVNTLALRTRFSPADSFKALLEKVKDATLGAYEHQIYPFDRLVDDLRTARDTSRAPLFDVAVALQNTEVGDLRPAAVEGVGVSRFAFDNPISKFDLTFNFRETADGLHAQLEYNADIFREETAAAMLGHLRMILRGAAADPERRLSDIAMLEEAERRKLLVEWNDRDVDHPKDRTVHELFEARVRESPNAVAVVFEEQQLTYEELNRRANQLAHRLKGLGVGPEKRVGMLMDRSLEMVVGLLAVLKAGGAYMPLDTRTPPERLSFILQESGVSILLTQSEFEGRFEGSGAHVISLDAAWDELRAEPDDNLPATAAPGNLMALLYTSGSTGRPKATMIDGRGFLNLCQWYQRYYPFTPRSRALLMMVFSFDAAFKNIVVPLLAGGRLILANPGYYDAATLLRAIKEQGVTFINTTPSQMYPIIELAEADDYQSLSSLECLIVGGEPMIPSRFRRWLNGAGRRCRLVNLYGPAECSDCVSPYEVSEGELNTLDSTPAGRAIDNARLYVLDERGALLPAVIPGELCVSGPLLARGYWRRPDLTAEKFVPNPFGDGERLYRTGDRARWRADGQIELLGRMDQGQVKLRGMRVELGEVEGLLNAHPSVREAVVIAREDAPGEKRLVAYFVSEEGSATPSGGDLRAFIRRSLPEYMIPSGFVALKALPLTQTGKLDRRNLPAPEDCETTLSASDTTYAAPSNDIEEMLVAAWQDVLGKQRVGVHDNYFDLGGDSIRVVRIAARLHQENLELKVRDLFLHPTVAALAPHVRRLGRAAEQSQITGPVPLTPEQAEFLSETTPEQRPHFGQSIVLTSARGFDREAVETMLARIVEHHDALRLTLRAAASALFNEAAGLSVRVEEFDLRDEAAQPPSVEEITEQLQGSFDLERGPLVKVALLRQPAGDRLLFVAHHLVIDDASWPILLEDLETLYRQYVEGDALALPAKTDPFKTWAEQLAAHAAGEQALGERSFWSGGETIAPLEEDYDDSGNSHADETTLSVSLGEPETLLLRNRANEAFNTETADLLLTALALAVRARYGREKFAVTLEGEGRKVAAQGFDFSRTVGCFTSRYPIVIDIDSAADTAQLIKEIKEARRKVPSEGVAHQAFKLLACGEGRAGAPPSLRPQLGFSYAEKPLKSAAFDVSWKSVERRHDARAARRHEFDVRASAGGDELFLTITFNQRRHRAPNAEAFLGLILEKLRGVIAFCAARETAEMTPSDFTYKELSIGEMDNIFDQDAF